MKSYLTQTSNKGKTIVLDSVEEAIAHGAKYVEDQQKIAGSFTGKLKVRTQVRLDDVTPKQKAKVGTMSATTFQSKWRDAGERYVECCKAISEGDAAMKAQIAELTETLRDAAITIEPMLAVSHRGYERSEDGVTASAELVASGEERCCFQRKRAGQDVQSNRTGDGAYKIIINTDVSWWGKPEDNAAVMGALVVLLQGFGPVEIWIQQGWLADSHDEKNGVTLFKLDFTGAFDPTQLAFWLGHPGKDYCFSSFVNKGLGRDDSNTSTHAEIPCDLYLRGDWMHLAGMSENSLVHMMHTERIDAMARWVAGTAMKIVQEQPQITG